jgi:class 3 adenylate cyclase
MSEAQGRGRGDRALAILFTDLVEFSDWALQAGDEKAVELLRGVGLAVEPLIAEHGGQVVKRLGDGLMAVFEAPNEAVDAALDAVDATAAVRLDGYQPSLRAGIHVGKPRRLGGDYLGVDVNVAARVAAAAGASEVLVSEAACEHLGDAPVTVRRRRRFKAKGAPSDLRVFEVAREE